MKHQIVHTLQKYLLNPPIKLALAVGFAAARICVPRHERTKDWEAKMHAHIGQSAWGADSAALWQSAGFKP
jgi:hypothetical protein